MLKPHVSLRSTPSLLTSTSRLLFFTLNSPVMLVIINLTSTMPLKTINTFRSAFRSVTRTYEVKLVEVFLDSVEVVI